MHQSTRSNLRTPRIWTARLAWALICAVVVGHLPPATGPAPSYAAGTSYFVDCIAGNDANSGGASTAAWKTLARANAAALTPGDQLLLKRNCVWTGPLVVTANGTASANVSIGAYGAGAPPTIENSTDPSDQALVIITGAYVAVSDLATRGTPVRTEPGCTGAAVGNRLGFYLHTGVHNVTLQRITASGHNQALLIMSGAHHNRVLDSHFSDNRMLSTLTPTSVNAGDDGGAAAVIILGNDNEIARTTISGSAACSYDFGTIGAALMINGGQRNTVHHTTATANLHFAHLSGNGAADNTVAYNRVTSAVPSASFLTTSGGVSRTLVYNNTVELLGAESMAVLCTPGCSHDVLALKNNIIWAEDLIGYSDAPFSESYNLFWRSSGAPRIAFRWTASTDGISPTSRAADPRFADRAAGDLRLQATSPAINAGTGESVSAGFIVDLAGSTVPQGGAVDLGAYETDVVGTPPGPAGQRVVSLSVNPQTSPPHPDGVIGSFDQAHAAGMRGNFLSWTWTELEPAAGAYNLADVAGAMPYLGGTLGLRQLVTLKIINTTVREIPADLGAASFDSPAVRARFRALIDALLPHLMAGRVEYLSLGNEVDRYLALNPAEAAAYRAFFADAIAYLHQVAPTIKVGVTMTFDGASDSAVAPLVAAGDVVVLTYYPIGENFIPRPPTAPLADFPQMIAMAGGRPVVLQEAGYPSSPVLASSEQAQSQFVTNLFTAWQAAPAAVPFVNLFAMHDLAPEVCADLEQYYGLVLGPNFTQYLCSLGLRRADGTTKPAWSAFTSGAAALVSAP